MFQKLDRGKQDQAARAGLALAARRLTRAGVQLPANEVGLVAHKVIGGEFAFPASSARRWGAYLSAVIERGEKVSNRRWAEYDQALKSAAREVADRVTQEAAALYEERLA